MNTNDWASMLPEKLQDFSDALQQCRDGAFDDLSPAALALDRIEAIFAEVLEMHGRLAQAADQER